MQIPRSARRDTRFDSSVSPRKHTSPYAAASQTGCKILHGSVECVVRTSLCVELLAGSTSALAGCCQLRITSVLPVTRSKCQLSGPASHLSLPRAAPPDRSPAHPPAPLPVATSSTWTRSRHVGQVTGLDRIGTASVRDSSLSSRPWSRSPLEKQFGVDLVPNNMIDHRSAKKFDLW